MEQAQRPDGPVGLLIVDDEEAIRNALKRFLAGRGYQVVTAGTGAEALDAVRRHKLAGILLDVRLPDANGVDLVPQLLEQEPHAAILMLTAVNDAASATLCMQRGAMDYLTKPVDLPDLAAAIERALLRRDTILESAKINQWLKDEVAMRTAELRMERANLERISVGTLEALVNALEAKDPYLRGHSARVADLSAMVAAELGLSDEAVEQVRIGGRLHDIGKIGIREEILNKQGPLTDDEFEHVKLHPVTGSEILAPLVHLGPVIGFVRGHHERWDGKGYPRGLAGDAIPLGARIVAVADAYDAITAAGGKSEKQALEVLAGAAGQFDPRVVEVFAAVHRDRLARLGL